MLISKKAVMFKIRSAGVVPVFYHPDVDVLLKIVSICYKCGLRVFEFMHQRDNRGLRYFEYLVERSNQFPDLTLGVGTVLDVVMTERYINSGAQFIASPFLRPDMSAVCQQYDTIWMPGCNTLAEIEKAKLLGATVINVLSGNVLGPDFISSVTKSHSNPQLIQSGISDLREIILRKWFEAGVLGIKLGSQVFTKEHVALKEWSAVEKSLTELLKVVSKIQSVVKPVNLDSISE
jgi:2-dehydro-3-deoxyphosphogluconate aldolase/(4S)-4-hydroxy-2-oxoglutarate aldolase